MVLSAVRRIGELVELHKATTLATIASEETGLLAQRRQTERRASRLVELRRARHMINARWSWRLVTISPPWRPWDETEFSPDRIRQRVLDVKARWRRVWAWGGCEQLAAAHVRVECSARGHVHLHALVFGPWWAQKSVARVAGCMVDVRALQDEGAVVEAVKYSLKTPVATGAWVGGERRRAAHPALAARWIIGSRSLKLSEAHGMLRDAIAAAEACDEKPDEHTAGDLSTCATCGSEDLTEWVHRRTTVVAKELGPLWRLRPKSGERQRVFLVCRPSQNV